MPRLPAQLQRLDRHAAGPAAQARALADLSAVRAPILHSARRRRGDGGASHDQFSLAPPVRARRHARAASEPVHRGRSRRNIFIGIAKGIASHDAASTASRRRGATPGHRTRARLPAGRARPHWQHARFPYGTRSGVSRAAWLLPAAGAGAGCSVDQRRGRRLPPLYTRCRHPPRLGQSARRRAGTRRHPHSKCQRLACALQRMADPFSRRGQPLSNPLLGMAKAAGRGPLVDAIPMAACRSQARLHQEYTAQLTRTAPKTKRCPFRQRLFNLQQS